MSRSTWVRQLSLFLMLEIILSQYSTPICAAFSDGDHGRFRFWQALFSALSMPSDMRSSISLSSASLHAFQSSGRSGSSRSNLLNMLWLHRWRWSNSRYLATSLGDLLLRDLPARCSMAVTPPLKYPARSRSMYAHRWSVTGPSWKAPKPHQMACFSRRGRISP